MKSAGEKVYKNLRRHLEDFVYFICNQRNIQPEPATGTAIERHKMP